MKKPLKITLIVIASIIGFVLLLLAAVSLFGGSIAKNYVNKHAVELTGRRAEVEHIGLNLFSGHVALHGLAVYEEDGAEKFAGFDTLDVAVSLPKLLSKTVFVKHVTLAGLDVQVLQDGSRFNFTSLLEHFASDSTEEEVKDTTPSGWLIDLHNIRIQSNRIFYADLQRHSQWGIKEFSLIVPDFCIGGDNQSDADLTLALADGGSLKVDAAFNAVSNDFDVDLSLDNFSLAQVKPYVVDIAYIDQIKGRLAIEAKAVGNLSKIMDMEVAAKVKAEDLDIIDNHSASVASLASLGVDVTKVVLGQNLFEIGTVALQGLTARYEVFADKSNTLSRFLKPQKKEPAAAPADSAAAPAKDMKLTLARLSVSDVSVTYADHTLPEPFSFPITKLRIESENVSLSGNNSARIFAALPHGALAVIDWAGNISDWKKHQSLKLVIKNLHLTDLSPYLLASLGQPFTDGVFSFTSNNTIRNSQLDGKNHIDIYKPMVGKFRKDIQGAKRLPVRAALYVLRDKDDKVVLDVPIAGNVSSPEFDYMKLVWKTLGNLFVKVATSPARALGNLVHGDDGDIFLPVDSADPDLTSEQLYKIDKLAEVVKLDESLSLGITFKPKPTEDSLLLANRQRRNAFLHGHLRGIGLEESQYTFVSAQPDSTLKKEGFVLVTVLKDDASAANGSQPQPQPAPQHASAGRVEDTARNN